MGFCAEFCGASHAWMQIRVVAQNEPDFQAWLKNQDAPPVAPVETSAKHGLEIYRKNTCVNCHSISGISTPIQIGPDLTHLASRETLVAGALMNNSDDLAQWLTHPDRVKPGAHMPAFGFQKDDLTALVSYLEGLK